MENGGRKSSGKFVFDIALSLLVLPLAVVLCALVAVPIAIEGRTNPFFMQTRVGRGEKPFRILKLRTMRQSAPTVASHAISSDYLLRTGKLARATKIDELPQLWNVLRGDMSLVGPRPCLEVQSELIAARRAHGVFALKPGITGVSQIKGLDMSTPELLAEYDATYLEPWSWRRDMAIIFKTATGGGQGDAARKAEGIGS